MKTVVPVEGCAIWADDTGGPGAGSFDAGGRDAVVLLHPGWGDARIWDDVLARLTGRRRVVRYDTRGYGSSPPPAAPFTQVRDLIAVLDQLEIARAVLVGHSGGGGTAIGLAIDQPHRVSALVLLAPGVPDYPWPGDDPYWQQFEAAFTAGDPDALAALGMRTWAAASADPAAKAQIRAAVAAFFRLGDFEQPDPPAFSRLGEIAVPAVVAVGDLEYPMVADCGRAVAERIPNCQLITVPGADHLLPLRAPELIADLVDQDGAVKR
ncbi:MAG TPA: alpha/beta fold hydrolase [Streptosporangiaceae bacterium]